MSIVVEKFNIFLAVAGILIISLLILNSGVIFLYLNKMK